MKMSKKLVFFGTENFSAYALEALIDNDWSIAAVVTKPDSRSGRGRKLQSPVVKEIAQKHSIDVLQPDTLKGFGPTLEKYGCDIAVLSAYGKIVTFEILKLYDKGIINIHPSLLPLHRGASPIERTILDGDKVAGVSLMKLVQKMDAGPVYAQSKLSLTGNETAPELYESLGRLGSRLLIEKLPSIVDGSLASIEQDDELATYAPMIKKIDGVIDWNNDAEIIERQIRAYLRWPSNKTTLADKQITITRARLFEESGKPGSIFLSGDEIGVYCKDTSIVIEKLKPDGKREMTASEFLAGHNISV